VSSLQLLLKRSLALITKLAKKEAYGLPILCGLKSARAAYYAVESGVVVFSMSAKIDDTVSRTWHPGEAFLRQWAGDRARSGMTRSCQST
jgi:hypothetical protein